MHYSNAYTNTNTDPIVEKFQNAFLDLKNVSNVKTTSSSSPTYTQNALPSPPTSPTHNSILNKYKISSPYQLVCSNNPVNSFDHLNNDKISMIRGHPKKIKLNQVNYDHLNTDNINTAPRRQKNYNKKKKSTMTILTFNTFQLTQVT